MLFQYILKPLTVFFTEFDAKIDRLCLIPNVAQIISMFRTTFLSILPNKLIFDL